MHSRQLTRWIPFPICHIEPIVAIKSNMTCFGTDLAERPTMRRSSTIGLRGAARRGASTIAPSASSRRRILRRTTHIGGSRWWLGCCKGSSTWNIRLKRRESHFMTPEETGYKSSKGKSSAWRATEVIKDSYSGPNPPSVK